MMIGEDIPQEIRKLIIEDLKTKHELQKEIDKRAKELRELRDKKRKYYTFRKIAKEHGQKYWMVEKLSYYVVEQLLSNGV